MKNNTEQKTSCVQCHSHGCKRYDFACRKTDKKQEYFKSIRNQCAKNI